MNFMMTQDFYLYMAIQESPKYRPEQSLDLGLLCDALPTPPTSIPRSRPLRYSSNVFGSAVDDDMLIHM